MSRRHGHNSSDLQLGVKDSTASIITNSHSFMTGGSSSSSNSSTAALQSLAARNARNNPSSSSSSAAGMSAGSILQNALSGATGGRGNPGFAPTLAQLLTNPAAEQQQQQQVQPKQQLQQQQQVMGPSSTAIQSAAEVLTLSNLLATAKVKPFNRPPYLCI
jgi:hypothetical protein